MRMNIWDVADRVRASGLTLNINNIIKFSRDMDVDISLDDLYEIQQRSGPYSEMLIPPKLVVGIFERIIQTVQLPINSNVFNPWDRTGLLFKQLSSEVKKHSIMINESYQEVYHLVADLSNHNINIGNPLELIDKVKIDFDLIVSCPPFGLRREQTFLMNQGEKHVVRDTIENIVLLKSCLKLKTNGISLFVVSTNFFKSNTRKLLNEFGFGIDAIFHLPSGVFAPFTQIPTYIIVIRRRAQSESVFLAEVGTISEIEIAIDNWLMSKSSSSSSHGSYVKYVDFESYEIIKLEKDILIQSRKLNLTPVPLMRIANEINLARKEEDDGFEDKPNSIYLPIIGNTAVVANISDFIIKPQNYIQVVIDNEIASSEYIARFFNSKIGELIRQRLLSGIIPKISKARLNHAVVYLPPKDIQIETIEVQNQINELKTTLTSIEQQVWNRPTDIMNIRKILKNVNRHDGFEEWVETLPFPLASVLWRYNASSDPRMKRDHLLHFFEALSQFVTIILLSAISSDKVFFESYKRDLFNDFKTDALYRSTFGTWNTLGERIGKLLRRELSSNPSSGNRERCLSLFQSKTPEFVNALISKKLFEVLKNASDFRNKWKGHGGVEGERSILERLIVLETELQKIREVFKEIFEDYILIKPGTSSYKSGIFQNQVTSLMGTRQFFKSNIVETTIPLENDQLYLYSSMSYEPIKLVPLIKFRPSPSSDENACYFYNRIEKSGVRWVSYHFESEAELFEESTNVQLFINDVLENV